MTLLIHPRQDVIQPQALVGNKVSEVVDIGRCAWSISRVRCLLEVSQDVITRRKKKRPHVPLLGVHLKIKISAFLPLSNPYGTYNEVLLKSPVKLSIYWIHMPKWFSLLSCIKCFVTILFFEYRTNVKIYPIL